ncbi:large ribosomal subunit protein bL21m [Trichomonascus vanleenenianus]|uniref:mitochondrial 54S ribosomal protein bL21m MRPL49 n=1 Tax=Trichomonascus vanleenenianus TaxID=2268995 RepID=UPI003ECB1ECB
MFRIAARRAVQLPRTILPACNRAVFASRAFSASSSQNKFNVDSVQAIDPEQMLKREYNYLKPEDLTPLKEAPRLYATVHIHDRKFLVQEGDLVTLPVRMSDVQIGDVLNFDQVSSIGSRDYTLTGAPRIDPSAFTIKGTVVEKTREKREVEGKTKPRRRHVRHIVKKNCLTAIRINQLEVN